MFFKELLINNRISKTYSFIWDSKSKKLKNINNFRYIDLDLLIGIDRQINTILNNTINFANGNFTNNVLLWGSRGNGKSSLIKSVFVYVNTQNKNLKLLHQEVLFAL